MGLLDDAIREHLDLKRRHGADPAELERAEREALGPVRREPEALPAEPPPYEGGLDALGTADVDPDSAPWDEPNGAPLEEEDLGPEPPARRSRLSRIFGRVDDEDEAYYEDDELEADEPEARDRGFHGEEEAPRRSVEADEGHHGVDQETAAFDVPGSHGKGAREDEDVLEETPEFLQDTPDHDRLWFEQRPPRDFDFDG